MLSLIYVYCFIDWCYGPLHTVGGKVYRVTYTSLIVVKERVNMSENRWTLRSAVHVLWYCWKRKQEAVTQYHVAVCERVMDNESERFRGNVCTETCTWQVVAARCYLAEQTKCNTKRNLFWSPPYWSNFMGWFVQVNRRTALFSAEDYQWLGWSDQSWHQQGCRSNCRMWCKIGHWWWPFSGK